MAKVFIDTNVLVYAVDTHDRRKQKLSRQALEEIESGSDGVISTQVMQEFYVAATKKLDIEPAVAKKILHSFENFEIVIVDPPLIKEAIDCSMIHQISFWDALVIVCADSAKCAKVWTEDLNHGQVINGVRVENRFKQA